MRRPGAWVSWRWREKERINLAGVSEWTEAAEGGVEVDRSREEAEREKTTGNN